ncbi:MAG: hypothetical protein AAGB18_07725, partial [Pseudomonadota bacterium]
GDNLQAWTADFPEKERVGPGGNGLDVAAPTGQSVGDKVAPGFSDGPPCTKQTTDQTRDKKKKPYKSCHG